LHSPFVSEAKRPGSLPGLFGRILTRKSRGLFVCPRLSVDYVISSSTSATGRQAKVIAKPEAKISEEILFHDDLLLPISNRIVKGKI
jgi:hypothetical protein